MVRTDAGDLTNVAAVLNRTHSRVYSLEPGDTATADANAIINCNRGLCETVL